MAAHFALDSAPLWGLLALILIAVPVVYAAMSAGRGAIAVVLLPAAALADNVIDAETAGLLGEVAILAVVMLSGGRLMNLVEEEERTHERVLAETLQRAARLKDQTGYWQNVARTRMGVYVTGVEEHFISKTMRMQPGAIVLDVGAASGRLEHALAEYAGHVIATDLDREEVYAMAEDERITPLVVSAQESLPVRSGSIDVIASIEAPAASDESWFRKECGRALTADGSVIITAFNARSSKGLIARLLRRGQTPWANLYYRMSLARQIRLWHKAGFDVVRRSGFYWSPLPRNSDSRWVSGWAALERLLGLRGLAAFSPWVMLELRKRDAVNNG